MRLFLMIASIFLSACGDAGKALSLDLAEHEYRRCFGSETVECEDIKIDLYIKRSEFTLDSINAKKEDFISSCSEDAYNKVVVMFAGLIEKLDNERPSIFRRILGPESALWSPSRVTGMYESTMMEIKKQC